MGPTTVSTISGREINVLHVQAELVSVEDIAHQLARIRRFTGATIVGYSVAAHALHVCDLVRKAGGTLGAQRAALHHDSHEYLIGDVTTPIKHAVNTIAPGAWRSFETLVQRQVLDALGLRTAFVTNQAAIGMADLVALATERRDLQVPVGSQWPCLINVQPDETTDVMRRALAGDDDQWAQAFIERDQDLRQRMAELAGLDPFIAN